MAENEKNPRGRPRFELTKERRETLLSLAQIGATNEEIADAIGCSHDTLTSRFAEFLRIGRNAGNVSLRRTLFQTANNGNPTVLIFLAKNHLGMKERTDVTSGDQVVKAVYGVDFGDLDPPPDDGGETPPAAPTPATTAAPQGEEEPGDAMDDAERAELFADDGGTSPMNPPTAPPAKGDDANPPEPPEETDGDAWKEGDDNA